MASDTVSEVSEYPAGSVLFTGLVRLQDGSLEHLRLISAQRGQSRFVEVDGVGEFASDGKLRRSYLEEAPEIEFLEAIEQLIREVA